MIRSIQAYFVPPPYRTMIEDGGFDAWSFYELHHKFFHATTLDVIVTVREVIKEEIRSAHPRFSGFPIGSATLTRR